MNVAPPDRTDPNVLPEYTKELCQLRWLDEALLPLNFFEHTWRFGMRRVRGLRRRLGLLTSDGCPTAGGCEAPRGASSGGAAASGPPRAGGRGRSGGRIREGDLVTVLPAEEIRKTLDKKTGKHGGLKFLPPMREYCGKTFRVMKRVRYILDEHDHKMQKVKNVVLLDGVICRGKGIYGRENCDRCCFFFWKDAWLRKVEED